MQMPPDGRIPVDRAIQILSFKKAGSPKDQDRIRRILDPAAVGSIPPAQLVRFLQQLRALQTCHCLTGILPYTSV